METFEVLKGKIITDISIPSQRDEIVFSCKDGTRYMLYHDQECCEHVTIEDIAGELKDLLDSPILLAEEVIQMGSPEESSDSETWTFYKLSTIKGSVTIRWYGSSNGYYSETVDFKKIGG